MANTNKIFNYTVSYSFNWYPESKEDTNFFTCLILNVKGRDIQIPPLTEPLYSTRSMQTDSCAISFMQNADASIVQHMLSKLSLLRLTFALILSTYEKNVFNSNSQTESKRINCWAATAAICDGKWSWNSANKANWLEKDS